MLDKLPLIETTSMPHQSCKESPAASGMRQILEFTDLSLSLRAAVDLPVRSNGGSSDKKPFGDYPDHIRRAERFPWPSGVDTNAAFAPCCEGVSSRARWEPGRQ